MKTIVRPRGCAARARMRLRLFAPLAAAVFAAASTAPAQPTMGFGITRLLDPGDEPNFILTDTTDDTVPRLARGAGGVVIAVWQSGYDPESANGPDEDIYFARSADDGETWSDPAALNSDAALERDATRPQIAFAGGATWVCVWEAEGALLFARSTDDGASWSPGAALDPGHAGESASLASDGASNLVAVWVDRASDALPEEADIFVSFSSDGGGAWSPAEALTPDAATDAGYDLAPFVRSDGAGRWMTVWQSENIIGGGVGADYDIHFSLSTDGGDTWSAPAAVNSNASVDAGIEEKPRLAADGSGTWVAVYESNGTLGGTIGTDLDILYSRTTDNGQNWSAVAPLNFYAGPDNGFDAGASIETDGAGVWIAVWNGGGSRIRAAVSPDDGATWPTAVFVGDLNTPVQGSAEIVRTSGGAWIAAIAAAGLADATGNDYEIAASRSETDGSAWSDAAALNTNAADPASIPLPDDDVAPALTTAREDAWMAVWEVLQPSAGGGSQRFVYGSSSADEGNSWSAPVQIAPFGPGVNNKNATWPAIAARPQGKACAVFQVRDSSFGMPSINDEDIYISRSTDGGGTWSFPLQLNSNWASDGGAWDEQPSIANDGGDNWIVAWRSNTAGGATVLDQEIVFSRSTNDAVTWSPIAQIDSVLAESAEIFNDLPPQVASNKDGTWLVVWPSPEPLGGTIGTDLDILFSRSTDNGANWTPAAPLNSTAAADGPEDTDNFPTVATDGRGLWVVAWWSTHNLGGTIGTDADIFVSRSLDDGISWRPVRVLNGNAEEPGDLDDGQIFAPSGDRPSIATDGEGSWAVIWATHSDIGGSLGSDRDIVGAFSKDNARSWSYPAGLNLDASLDLGYDAAPALAVSAEGMLAAVWSSSDALGGELGSDPHIFIATRASFPITGAAREIWAGLK